MKPVYLISKKLGTAVMRYSCILPLRVLNEEVAMEALTKTLQSGQALSGFTIIHQCQDTSEWVELSAEGKQVVDEDVVLEKVVSFLNSAAILNATVINPAGEMNLDDEPHEQYLRQLGFASVQTSFIMNQLGYIDTTLSILPDQE